MQTSNAAKTDFFGFQPVKVIREQGTPTYRHESGYVRYTEYQLANRVYRVYDCDSDTRRVAAQKALAAEVETFAQGFKVAA